MRNLKALFVLLIFTITTLTPPEGWAQVLGSKSNSSFITAIGLMPRPGSPVSLSAGFDLAHFKGMVIDPNDPFKFDFIIHQGDQQLSDAQKKSEYTKLIKYFLAALAVPDTDQWVNLSPYEKDRIIPNEFGKTAMGRDLLAQDYLLKQLSSSLTNPDTGLGQKFWDQVYERVYKEFGTRDVPLNTFNKVWIVPDKAVIYEKGNMVYVVSSHLKVLTEEDYLAMKKHQVSQVVNEQSRAVSISNKVMRDVIIPAIEQEVNEGKNFAPLRQVFSGMLLATWYKRALKESILTRLYANKGKLKGVDQDPKTNLKIYQDYLKAYKKGVYNMIKEETDPATQEVIPRKYFSGGTIGYVNFAQIAEKATSDQFENDLTQESSLISMVTAKFNKFTAQLMAISKQLISPVLKVVRPLAVITAGLSLSALIAKAQGVNLAWNLSPDPTITRYVLSYGTQSGVYTSSITVSSNQSSVQVSGLQSGVQYFFNIQAANTNALGAMAGEISYVVPGVYNSGTQVTQDLAPGTTVSTTDTNMITDLTDTNGVVSYTAENNTGTTETATISETSTNGVVTQEIVYIAPPVGIVPLSNLTYEQRTNGLGAVHQYPIVTFNYTNNLPNTSYTIYVYMSEEVTTFNPTDPGSNWQLIGQETLNPSTNSSVSITSPLNTLNPSQYFNAVAVPNQALLATSDKNRHELKKNKIVVAATKVISYPVPIVTTVDRSGKRVTILSQRYVPQRQLALQQPGTSNAAQLMPGGIDFAQSNLDMQIKRDGKGVVLPMSQQNLDNIRIDGLVPEILEIKPVESSLLFNKNMEGNSV